MTLEEILKVINKLTDDDFLQLRVEIRRLCRIDANTKITIVSSKLMLLLASSKAAKGDPLIESASPASPNAYGEGVQQDTGFEILRTIVEEGLPPRIANIFSGIMALDIEIRQQLAQPIIKKIIEGSPHLKPENIRPWEIDILAVDMMAAWLNQLVPLKSLLTPNAYAHFSILSDIIQQVYLLHPVSDKVISTVCGFENYLLEAYNKAHDIDTKIAFQKEALKKATEKLNLEINEICEKKSRLKERLNGSLTTAQKSEVEDNLNKLDERRELVDQRLESISEPYDNKIIALEMQTSRARKQFKEKIDKVFAGKLSAEEEKAINEKMLKPEEPKKNLIRQLSLRSLQFILGRKPPSREGSPSITVFPPRVGLTSSSSPMGGSPRLIASSGSSPRIPSNMSSTSSSPRNEEGVATEPSAVAPIPAAAVTPVRTLKRHPSLLGPNRPPSTDPTAESNSLSIPRLSSAPSAAGYSAKSPTSPLRNEGLMGRRGSSGGKVVEAKASDGKEERSPSTVRRPPG